MTKSKRVTLPAHHLTYLQSIASQMGVPDENIGETLNFLLWELRRSNYQFGQSLPVYQQQLQQPLQQQFDPSNYETEKATAMSALSWQPQSPQAIREFEQVAEECDPIIQRLALLVDSF